MAFINCYFNKKNIYIHNSLFRYIVEEKNNNQKEEYFVQSYLNSYMYVKCQENCKKCFSNEICSICKEGFYLSNSSCIKCASECQTCSDHSQKCLKCSDGSIPQGNNNFLL